MRRSFVPSSTDRTVTAALKTLEPEAVATGWLTLKPALVLIPSNQLSNVLMPGACLSGLLPVFVRVHRRPIPTAVAIGLTG
jgi:hypothetical protein